MSTAARESAEQMIDILERIAVEFDEAGNKI